MDPRPLDILPLTEFDPADPLLHTVQQKIREAIPPDLQRELHAGSIEGLQGALPLLEASPSPKVPWITLICPAEYTHGVGSYFCDTLCRWLVPGKHLPIVAHASLCFALRLFPAYKMYLHHIRLLIEKEEDGEIAAKNSPVLLQEMRLNIKAVHRARYIVSLKNASPDQKRLLMEENLRPILRASAPSSSSLFDQMHHFLGAIAGEEKLGEIRQLLTRLHVKRPQPFDRGVFYEMTHFTLLFKDPFAAKRDPRHISRVIALFYLFKKALLQAAQRAPQEKHLSLRLFRTRLEETKPVLCLLLGLNRSKESHRVNHRWLLEAIQTLLPNIAAVKDSYLADRREEKISFFYLEVANPSHASFSLQEVQLLREKLGAEIRRKLEVDVHSIFLPRNEEDFARNLIVLSQEIKAMKDLPQISIHFDRQTDGELLFSVFVVRLLLPGLLDLRELLFQGPRPFKFSIEEMRKIGALRRKTPKEAAVLKVTLEKPPFFRGDFSVDLLKARQRIADELTRILGPYRDFNGGMLLKQQEALRELWACSGEIAVEAKYLLEDYFYSIRPGVMQTLLPPEILRRHFQMLTQLQQRDAVPLLEERLGPFSLFFTEVSDPSLKERVDAGIEKLEIPSYEWASCFIQLPSMVAAGFLLRSENLEVVEAFRALIEPLPV